MYRMEVQQDPRLCELISSCGKQMFSCDRFIKYLGLPLREKNRATGWKDFEDDTGRCKELYRSVLGSSKELYESYESAQEMRDALRNPSKVRLLEVTGNLLSDFGRSIWKESGALTRINEDYPRFLNYENSEDLQRIRLCLYYWILHHALQRYFNSKRSNATEKYQALPIDKSSLTCSRGPQYVVVEESEVDSSGEYEEDGNGIESEYIFTETRQMHREDISSIEDFPTSQPRESPFRRTSRSPSRTGPPSRTDHSPKTKRRDTIPPHANADKFSFKRPYPSEDQESDTGKKTPRLISSNCETSSSKMMSQVIPKSDKPCAASEMRVDTRINGARYLPHAMPPTPDEMICFDREKTNGSDDDSCVVIEASPKTLQQDERRPSLIVILKTGHPGNRAERQILSPSATPSEIFPCKELQAPVQPLQLDRNRLTANLLELLENPKQSITALDETVKQIRRITEGNTLEIHQTFGNSERYQKVLNSWLECTGAFVDFRRVTGFEGEKEQWIEFFKSLTPDQKKPARSAYIHTRLVTSRWQHEPDFSIGETSRDLAHVLFNLTSWDEMMDIDEMQQLCMDFNKRLLAWFS